MPTRDVRVRLSAEGQAEVIGAFRRVQEETDKAARSAKSASSGGFKDLKEAAHSLALEYLALESAMKVFEGLKRAVETSVEYATGIEKAAQKTGFAAETLQVYGLAAQQIGIDQEVVTKGLIKFQKSMGDLELGSVKAKNAIKELFGNSDALKGLPDEARLNKVTEALAKMEPGAKRTSVAIALFGKAGAELLPVIDNLGAQGFDNLKKKLEDYGLALDEQGIQRMRQAEAAMADLKLAARGIQMQFTEGLVPALSDVGEGLAGTIGPAGWKGFGEAAGSAIKGAMLWVGTFIISLREVFDKFVVIGEAMYKLTDPMTLGRLMDSKGGVKAAFASIADDVRAGWVNASSLSTVAINALADVVADKVQTIKKNIRSTTGDANSIGGAESNAALERLLRARLEFTQAELADELAVYKETAKLEGEQEKAKYDAGLESIKTYFDNRRAAIAADNEREVALLEAKRDALAAQPKSKDAAAEMKLQKDLIDNEAKIQILKTQGAEAALRLAHEEVDAHKKNASEVLGFEEKILIAQGKRHEAEAKKIDEELEKYGAALRGEGLAEDEIAKRVANAGGILKAENDFAELKRTVEEGLTSMSEARAKIEELAARGAISQGNAARELHKLDADRLPALRAIVEQMKQIAILAGNPDLVRQAEGVAKSLDDQAKAAAKAKTEMQQAGTTLEKDLGRSISTFFTSGITHAKSFGDAIRGLGMSVAQDIQKMFLTLIENMIKAKIAASLTDQEKSGGGSGGILGFLSAMSGKAEGGPVYGPGGIDNVPAWLTHGEFVVRESVARQPGMTALLSALNDGLATPTLRAGGRMGFAQGGVVEGGFVAGNRESNPQAQMTVGLDYGLVLKHISAHPDFGRVLIKHLDLNRRAAGAALGVSGHGR
jgi:hypothetical protein